MVFRNRIIFTHSGVTVDNGTKLVNETTSYYSPWPKLENYGFIRTVYINLITFRVFLVQLRPVAPPNLKLLGVEAEGARTPK